MIETENLNNQSVEEILEEAINNVVYRSDEWTDFQEADPGITLVELFAWLNSAQHQYLNVLSSGVQDNFLKLLDINLHPNKASETYIEVSEIAQDVNIPARTQWAYGDMIFENIGHQKLTSAKILNVSFQNPEFPSEQEYYKFDGTKSFYLFGRDIHRKNDKDIERSFTINFDKALPPNAAFNLYFSIYNGNNIKRNPIRKGNKFVPMAKVKWEYYGDYEGHEGWHGLIVDEDNTYNFLFSGIVKLRFSGLMKPIDEVYKIRATLVYDEYDYPPRIDKILTNVIRVCQHETWCDNVIVKKESIENDRTVKIFTNMAIYGRSEVYLKKHGGWVKTEAPTFKSLIKNGQLIVDLSKVWDEIKDIKSGEEAVMVASYNKDKIKSPILGSGTGISEQRVKLDTKNILTGDLEIMVSEKIDGEEVYFKWKQVKDFSSSGKYDRHYAIDQENDEIVFGDHEHGIAPRSGNGNIRLCRLRRTAGKDSNCKEGLIDKVITMNKVIKNSYIKQIAEATGGEDEETVEHAKARAAELFSNPERAITLKDYEYIVKKTPGLTFTNVKILPNYMPGENTDNQNCVTVAVRWNNEIGLTLPKSFEQNIMNQIDKYRLINTKIKVVSPAYIGLVISGDIVVDSSYREAEGLIEDEVKKFVNDMNKDLGQTLHFGDMFGMIDRLKYVSRLEKLRILPLGEGATKNVSDDIVIPPNGVYYIDKIDFNYIKESEIFRS